MSNIITSENIIFSIIHKIDRDTNTIEKREYTNDDVKDYITGMMTEIMENKNFKYYNALSSTTEVFSIVLKELELEGTDPNIESNIAKRYLDKEIIGHERAARMKQEVKRGYLIQSLFIKDECYYYLISKLEIDGYFDEIEFHRRSGFPYANRALKSCLYKFNSDKELEDIYVTDKQDSKYWHEDFLELVECSGNEKSTKEVFSLIEKKIRLGTKKSSADYYALRNNLVTYFQSPRVFSYDDMEHVVFENYEAKDPANVDINKIKQNIYNEILSNKYNTSFTIVPTSIKTKLKKSIKINSFINLQFDGGDENYTTMISSFIEEGKKYIRIVADDDAYEIFKGN